MLNSLGTEAVQISLACVSVVCSVLFIIQNWVRPDKLGQRLREIENERERIRLREREKLGRRSSDLISGMKSNRLYEEVVKKFNLLKTAEEDEVALPLRRAGFRGRAPVVTYLISKLVLPPIAFLLSFIYAGSVFANILPNILLLLIAGLFGYASTKFPDIYLKNRQIKRQNELNKFWPDTLDLMLISVESGMSIEAALRTVAREIGFQSHVISEELLLTLAELSYLQDRKQAFRNLELRTNTESVSNVVAALMQAERYGTSLAGALRSLARENRDIRMAEAERRAAALPPRLTVPMIIFFLPVLFVIIITPAILQILPMMK